MSKHCNTNEECLQQVHQYTGKGQGKKQQESKDKENLEMSRREKKKKKNFPQESKDYKYNELPLRNNASNKTIVKYLTC